MSRKVPMGRPVEYTPEVLSDLAKKLIEWIAQDVDNIFINEFCLLHNLDKFHIDYYCEKSAEFSQAYKQFQTNQELKLCKMSYLQKRSEGMCKFLLVNNHDYLSDKSQAKIEQEQKLKVNVEVKKVS